jgi:GT2 family glycosyltransferase
VLPVAIAIPSLNQGRFLDAALRSLIDPSGVSLRIAFVDGGSTDETLAIANRYSHHFGFSRSRKDDGQAAAINEGLARLLATHPDVGAVGWLNADDVVLPGGLAAMAHALEAHPSWVAVGARGQTVGEDGVVTGEYRTVPFSRKAFAYACRFCQPATLIRREAWERVGGLDTTFDMSFDYDLWWRLAALGPIGFVDVVAAASREHGDTKTRTRRRDYFRESMAIVQRETGRVGWHWCISEALERQDSWSPAPRLGLAGKAVAGLKALGTYAGRNLRRARPSTRTQT